MKHNLTASIFILMMYVNFMGPFILQKESADFWQLKRRRLELRVSDIWSILGIICYVVAALLCFAIFSLLSIPSLPILALFGAIVLMVIAAAAIVAGTKCLVAAIRDRQNGGRRRALTQEPVDVMTKDNLDRIKEKTREFIAKAKLETKYEHRIAEAETKTLKKWFKRKMRGARLMKMPQVAKPMETDKLNQYMRKLYTQEFKDIAHMHKEIESMKKEQQKLAKKNKTTLDLDYIHGTTCDIRRHFQKIRIQKAIDLLQTHTHVEKKYQSTWEYRYTKHKEEIDEMDAKIKDENVPKTVRDEIQKKMDSLLKGDNEAELTEEGRKVESRRIDRMYTYAGMTPRMMKLRFFMWYLRAKSALLLMEERVKMTRMQNETPLSVEQQENIQKAILKIDEAIHNISEGVDLN